MSLARRPWFLVVFFGLLIVATRVPLAPGQLFTFDDVNFAYSIGHFDIRASQPHPPGYPLFVLQMRVLWWLRFRRVETLLFALALAGSIAAIALVAVFGNRFLGGASGFWAAWMMVFHPVFWHAGVISALRVQLAMISLTVAAACWRAWRGDDRWVLWSAVALGLGAGIRPETGPLLFPLWAASAWRAPVSRRQRGIALAAMAGIVVLWLAPAMIASGGPVTFVRTCLDYISDQASVSSGLFGATESRWRATFWRMIAWLFCGVLGWGLPAVLAWRRHEGWAIGPQRLAFLALWFVPPFAFALLVHVEDPGHALAMIPIVALVGGYLMDRAIDTVTARVSRWHAPVLMAAAVEVAWIVDKRNVEFQVATIPLVCLAAALLLKPAQIKNIGAPPRLFVTALLLAPVLALNIMIFEHRGWYYRGTAQSGWRATAEQITADLTSGLSLTSKAHIEDTLKVDDAGIHEIRRLAAERPGNTVVLWERGLTSWRKIAYYNPALPVFVLEHKQLRSGSPAVVARWMGPHLEARGGQRVALPAGARVIRVTPEPVTYLDLPNQSGELAAGEWTLVW